MSAVVPRGKSLGEFDDAAVDCDSGCEDIGAVSQSVDSDVSAPRLTNEDRVMHTEFVEGSDDVGDNGVEVVTVVGFVAQSMSSQIDRNTRNPVCCEGDCYAVPHSSIRSQTMDEHENRSTNEFPANQHPESRSAGYGDSSFDCVVHRKSIAGWLHDDSVCRTTDALMCHDGVA